MNESAGLTGGARLGSDAQSRPIQPRTQAPRSSVSLQERDGQSGGHDAASPGPRNTASVAELTCTDVRSQLNDLLDGSLDTPARQRLERHLVQCTDCEALRRTLEQTVQGLGGLGPIRTPTGMRDRLRQRLKDQESAE
jgi:hypothetical protein